jgi:hypothetical protein
MKLESHPGMSLAHAGAAINRYILKRQKRTSFEKRREDAYKDPEYSGRPDELRQAAINAAAQNVLLWPAHAANAARYDDNLRVGMEMFVPAQVVASLI